MKGDDQVRHCQICDRKVFNLSNMAEADGLALLRQHSGRLCVRYYRRSDGTVMTKDCGFVERTEVRMKSVWASVLTLFLGVVGMSAFTPVMGARIAPATMAKHYVKRVRQLSEEIRIEKDPEARKLLMDMRAEASKSAREWARRAMQER
jgi:hypothetical protein